MEMCNNDNCCILTDIFLWYIFGIHWWYCSALSHSKGGAGFITKINSDLDACFVKWDLTEEECGWYRCGAYGLVCYNLWSQFVITICVFTSFVCACLLPLDSAACVPWRWSRSSSCLVWLHRCVFGRNYTLRLLPPGEEKPFQVSLFVVYLTFSWFTCWRLYARRLIVSLLLFFIRLTGDRHDDHWRKFPKRHWKSVSTFVPLPPTPWTCKYEQVCAYACVTQMLAVNNSATTTLDVFWHLWLHCVEQ